MSIQTTFINNNLDNLLTDDKGSFTTLTVTGRGSMTNRLLTHRIPGMDGLYEDDSIQLEPRPIIVKFRLTDKTNEGFRKRLDKLKELLVGSKRSEEHTSELQSRGQLVCR